MPYVKQEKKEKIRPCELPGDNVIDVDHVDCAGDLNYAFTELAIAYLKRKGLNYQHINDVVGALDGAKAEFQRRVVAPYEDEKIGQNGDVYPPTTDGVPTFPKAGKY